MRYTEEYIFVPHRVSEGAATRVALIQELIDNGKASYVEDSEEVRIAAEDAASFTGSERDIIGLPRPYPYTIQLDARGSFADPDLAIQAGYFSFPGGAQLPGKRVGAVLEIGERRYLLSEGQLRALSSSQQVTGTNGRREALASVARLKEATKGTSVSLDDWLESENVQIADKLSIRVERNENGVRLSPELKETPAFQERFDAIPSVQDAYNIPTEDGGRTRVVLTDEQKRGLAIIKRLRAKPLTDEETLQVVENAHDLFGESAFDLDEFSQRVQRIGIYRPRFYPFISPYKTEWFPGFVSEAPDGEREYVRIESQEELGELKEAIQAATTSGSERVHYGEHAIPTEVARHIATNAERQLSHKSAPHTRSDKKVLIIEENVDATGYRTNTQLEDEEPEYAYHAPDSMREPFEPKAHQREAIAWLQTLSNSVSGVLLADDMGLGKTLTVLAFLRWADQREPYRGRAHLVVAPLSLLENWSREYKKFFLPGRPNAEILQGSRVRERLDSASAGTLYLTTYETVRKHQLSFGRVDWGVVAMDEVQRIKTPGTLITNAAKALKAEFRIGMTGTPVENTLVDLWCIVDFLVPGYLGSARDFKNRYEKARQREEASLQEVGESLRSRLGALLKRRLKRDVLGELPAKIEHRKERHMTDVQASRYKAILAHVNALRRAGGGQPGEILSALTRLKLVSDHPVLVGEESKVADDQSLIYQSAKMLMLRDILSAIRKKDEKVIVFAELKRSQRMIAMMIQKEYGFLPRIVNGDMPANASRAQVSRQQAIDEFESTDGFSAIVMSPIAAGVGLNVTAANHVVHYSRHWNPAKEQQATDRAYRIGQQKEVHVYYLLGTLEGVRTFDQLLDKLLSDKKALAEATLFPSERIEVRSADILDEIGSLEEPDLEEVPLSTEDVLALSDDGQRAVLAALMERDGYEIELLADEERHGADLLAHAPGQLLVVGRAHSGEANQLAPALAWAQSRFPAQPLSSRAIEMMDRAQGHDSLASLLAAYPITEADLQRFYPVESEIL